MTDSNTADNSRKASGKPFTKGDPRINRKGRPRSFDALRELAQVISHEPAMVKNKDTGESVKYIIDGHIVTVTEAILRQWASSKDPRLQMAFIEIAFGKVPQRSELTGAGGKELSVSLVEIVKDYSDAI